MVVSKCNQKPMALRLESSYLKGDCITTERITENINKIKVRIKLSAEEKQSGVAPSEARKVKASLDDFPSMDARPPLFSFYFFGLRE
jgi:hypothetical protein